MTNPLTDQQLNDIATRAQAATDGPWERYAEYGPTFFANIRGSHLQGVGDFNFGVGEQAEADEAFVRHAQQDVTALLAEVLRLRGVLEEIRHLHKDSPMGPCPTCIDPDAVAAGGDGLVPYPCPTGRLAGAQGCDPPHVRASEEQPAVAASEACGKCKQPFDSADTRFDGRAQYQLTPYCRGCVDRCHDNEIADHRCVICA